MTGSNDQHSTHHCMQRYVKHTAAVVPVSESESGVEAKVPLDRRDACPVLVFSIRRRDHCAHGHVCHPRNRFLRPRNPLLGSLEWYMFQDDTQGCRIRCEAPVHHVRPQHPVHIPTASCPTSKSIV